MTAAPLRVGVDVGGTFTDFVLVDPRDGRVLHHKEPSDPADPAAPVAAGLLALVAQAGADSGAIGLLVHGTTIGLNAILQQRGARLALVVSRGNRDVLEIARSRMPASYDVFGAREPPLVPRDRVLEISARMTADGRILRPCEDGELDRIAAAVRASGAAAVAVVLLNAYRDGALERQVADGLAARLPGIPITSSAAIWPEIREYERALVACLNAGIQPIMGGYFDRLERLLRAGGFRGELAIAANNGGMIALATARTRPIETILSGPATGVAAAARLAAACALGSAITIDMGGTSADMAVIEDESPAVSTGGRVGDYPLILPMVGVSAIGAGGGSIAWRDAQGVLKVGPESAGAAPGPACYGRGGERPTVTDAYVATGLVARLLGGRMRVERALADAALGRLAAELGLDGPAAAGAAVLRVATAKMAVELSKQLALRGLDRRRFVLIAFGGAGATHAALLAAAAGLPGAVIPPRPGTFCALGGVLADRRRDFAATLRVDLDGRAESAAPVAAAFAALEDEATQWLRAEGIAVADATLARAIDLRYPAQAHELTVPVAAGSVDAAAVCATFHAEHRRLYGFAESSSRVQTNTVRLTATVAAPPFGWPRAEAGRRADPTGRRSVYHDGCWQNAAVYDRLALPAETLISGPAIIEQSDTTVWIPFGWRARVDALGCLHLAATAGTVDPGR